MLAAEYEFYATFSSHAVTGRSFHRTAGPSLNTVPATAIDIFCNTAPTLLTSPGRSTIRSLTITSCMILMATIGDHETFRNT